MRAIMMKRLTVTGSTLRASPAARKVALADALREKVWPLFAQGKLKVVIARDVPLAEAAKAHALMESGTLIGKIALQVEVTLHPSRGCAPSASSVRRAAAGRSNTAPVENEQSSLASQHTSAAISSTVPKRPIGIFDSMKSMCCCVIWSKIAGAHRGGRHAVHADAGVRELLAQRLGEADHRRLRRAVRRCVRDCLPCPRPTRC